MKHGRFFQIPEKPCELSDLWTRAQAVPPDARPDWMTLDDLPSYRLMGSASSADLSAAEKAAFAEELDEMAYARLIVQADPRDENKHFIYIGAPRPEPVWSIGIYRGPSPLELAAAEVAQPVLTAESVSDVGASFVADPFWIRDPHAGAPGRWYMFFEVMNWKENVGQIGLATSGDGLRWRYEQIVLSESFHLSYPHVFTAADGVYMMPESFQDNSVRLYRARRFPHDWEHVATILSGGYYADASPFRHGDLWWLFTETGKDSDDTLRLFYADHLYGPWREHPKSPVVRGDASISRPAGRVLVRPRQIVRIAQNCSVEYGTDVRAIEITRLTRTEYDERPLPIAPILGPSGRGWNASGMHHVDAMQLGENDWLAAVDGWEVLPREAMES
jgi:hypothetical protein